MVKLLAKIAFWGLYILFIPVCALWYAFFYPLDWLYSIAYPVKNYDNDSLEFLFRRK